MFSRQSCVLSFEDRRVMVVLSSSGVMPFSIDVLRARRSKELGCLSHMQTYTRIGGKNNLPDNTTTRLPEIRSVSYKRSFSFAPCFLKQTFVQSRSNIPNIYSYTATTCILLTRARTYIYGCCRCAHTQLTRSRQLPRYSSLRKEIGYTWEALRV